jgi:phosphoadenosine phosphosulfate reductase
MSLASEEMAAVPRPYATHPRPAPHLEFAPAAVDTQAFLEAESGRLESATAEEILAWAIERYFPHFTMATGLGPEGCVIISMLAKLEPRVHVFNLDTGYQFAETLALRERIMDKYGMSIHLERPEQTVAEYEAANGGPVYRTESDRCCRDRKIRVLQRVSARFQAWATGIRRDQSPTRANTPIVQWDKKFGLVKISPLARWTKKEVWARIVSEGVPYNPLHDQGYPSVGCWPCTRPVAAGEDERAGRWSGTSKTECGLHTPAE